MSTQNPGYLVISLDFELFWGMFDKVTLAKYGPNVLGERTAIPRMLELFQKYGIHATWAGVGMLMARNKEELIAFLPPTHLQPRYTDMKVSSYEYLKTHEIGENESDDPYHFGPSLVKAILETPNQEYGNHTFSHYYCIDGHTNSPEIFARDLEAHKAIAQTYGITTTSIIFPRNQMSDEALRVCHTYGIRAYRGNEDHFLYRPREDDKQSLMIRAFRLLDHYINISGYHTYTIENKKYEIINIPASRFFRPWSRALSLFEPIRMRRIKNAMTHAAKRGEIFHLWWHPHNVGINQEQNFKNLENILEHFTYLQKTYGMQSASMHDIAEYVTQSQ